MDLPLFVLLNGILFHQQIKADNNDYSEGGWRPILNEGRFNYFSRNVIKANTQGISSEQSADNIILGDFVKTTDPPGITRINENNFLPIQEYNNIIYGESSTEPSHHNNEEKGDFLIEQNGTQSDQNYLIRTARKMNPTKENLIHINFHNNNTDNKNFKESYLQLINETNFDAPTNKYEVIEIDNEKDSIAMDQNVDYTKNIKSTTYVPIKDKKRGSLTQNLLSILANYNIRTSDKLTNYPFSLRQNSRNTENYGYAYYHVPIRVPLKYNNANHLLVDPLLAVLLSNYGHYMSGQFGIRTNYNNLYGYLASNNIHNNKPFGSYKIFSDTDSSF